MCLLSLLYCYIGCCAWLLYYATVPLTTTFFWFSISFCVSTTMCMAALLCYCPSYNHLFLVLYQFPVFPLQCAWLLCNATLSVPCVSTTMCMVALLCYCPSYNHFLLVLYQFPVCPLQCAWLLCYATVPLATTFFWFSISSLCVHYNEVNDLTILLNHYKLQHHVDIIYYALFVVFFYCFILVMYIFYALIF